MKYNYTFKDKELFKLAVTHISLANINHTESNQRLEFLGDSVLSFVVSNYIYNEYKNVDEGALTELRANAVCEKTLAIAARKLELGNDIRFGKSERMSGGKDKDSVLADAYEAVLAAIFLDGGIDCAREFVMNTIGDLIGSTSYVELENYKSEIQSFYQKRDRNRDVVKYRLVSKTGPDHDPTFNVEAVYQDIVIGTGSGKNRKSAEQEAAKQALKTVRHK
ncbi:MAG: ribonuclease III [Clostridiales bacterium]|nr:ribonuclease III [Clostridiales bacterium]